MIAVVVTWAGAGSAIGLVSAMMERKPDRAIAAGFAAGLLGRRFGRMARVSNVREFDGYRQAGMGIQAH